MKRAQRDSHRRMLLILAGCLIIGWLAGCVTISQPVVQTQMPASEPGIVPVSPNITQLTATPNMIVLAPETSGSPCSAEKDRIEQACTSASSGLMYWLYLPANRAKNEKLPLLIYLHGFSHSGSSLDLLLSGGLPAQIESGRTLPMVVISPQCPGGENWQSDAMVERLSGLVSEATAQYGIDPRQVYLTGFSMGGDGVWALGIAHPKQFAALAPVGSWYQDERAVCAVKNVPVWDFQGEQDQIVSPAYAKKMTAALAGCGGMVKLTLLPGADHEGSSQKVYGMDELYSWLLRQNLQ